MPENYQAYTIVMNYSYFLGNGMGGVSAEGLRMAFELEEIPKDEWHLLTRKILNYLATINKEKKSDGKKSVNRHNSQRQSKR